MFEYGNGEHSMRHHTPHTTPRRIARRASALLAALALCGANAVCAAGALDKTYTNSIGMEFVLIPAGTFQMGWSSRAEECRDDEKPRHEVTISKPFYLGKSEVTQAQWEAVMGNNPSRPPSRRTDSAQAR